MTYLNSALSVKLDATVVGVAWIVGVTGVFGVPMLNAVKIGNTKSLKPTIIRDACAY